MALGVLSDIGFRSEIMKKSILMLLLIPVLFGCSGLPLAERQNNATTEVSEKWSRNQREAIKVAIGAAGQSGQPSTVEWTADNIEAGNGDQSLATQLEQTIPGGLKMIYAGIGICVLVVAASWLRKSSATANAVIGGADRGFASAINMLSARIQATTSSEEKAALLTSLSELEKARGKAARKI